jgi:hypothetical protein
LIDVTKTFFSDITFDGTGYFLFFVEKLDIKGQHSDTLPI